MRKLMLLLLLFIWFPFAIQAQYTLNENVRVNSTSTVTTFNHVSGYVEVRDSAYFNRLDNIVQHLYIENMGFYNKAIDYYNAKDYESAYFYFNKAFHDKFKVKPGNDVLQNKALYAFLSLLKIANPQWKEIQKMGKEVSKECDPEHKRIAKEAYAEYKKTAKPNW